jgi:hypothetical protein
MMNLGLEGVFLMKLYGEASSPYPIDIISIENLEEGLIIEGKWPGCSENNYRLIAKLHPWNSHNSSCSTETYKEGIFIYGLIMGIDKYALSQNNGLIYPVNVCEPILEIPENEKSYKRCLLKATVNATTNACKKLREIEKSYFGQKCVA